MAAQPADKASSPTHLMELFAKRAAAGNLDKLMELYKSDAVYGITCTDLRCGWCHNRPKLRMQHRRF